MSGSRTYTCMGFGSYDENEQENQQLNTDEDDQKDLKNDAQHEGELDFEMEDIDSALKRLKDME